MVESSTPVKSIMEILEASDTLIPALTDEEEKNLPQHLQSFRQLDVLNTLSYVPTSLPNYDALSKGLDVLRDAMKSLDEDEDDDVIRTKVKDIPIKEVGIATYLKALVKPAWDPVNDKAKIDKAKKKQQQTLDSLEFITEVYGQLSRITSMYALSEEFLKKAGVTLETQSKVAQYKIYTVGQLIFKFPTLQKDQTILKTEINKISTELQNYLEDECKKAVSDPDDRDTVMRLYKNATLGDIESDTTKKQNLLIKLSKVFADQQSEKFINAIGDVSGDLLKVFTDRRDRVYHYQNPDTKEGPTTMQRFYRTCAQIITVGGLDKSNTQKRVKIYEEKRSAYMKEHVESNYAKPILTFSELAYQRYELEFGPARVENYSFLNGSQTLHASFKQFIESEAFARALQFRSYDATDKNTEEEVKADFTKALVYYERCIRLLGALNPQFLDSPSEEDQTALENLVGVFYGELGSDEQSVKNIKAIDNAHDEAHKKAIAEVINRFLFLADNNFTNEFIQLVEEDSNAYMIIESLNKLRSQMQIGTSISQLIKSISLTLDKRKIKKSMNDIIDTSEEELPKKKTTMEKMKRAATTALPYITMLSQAASILSLAILGNTQNFGPLEWTTFATSCLDLLTDVSMIALKGISKLSFGFSKKLGAWMSSKGAFTAKTEKILGLQSGMTKGQIMADIGIRAVSLLQGIVSIWNCVEFAKKASNTIDSSDRAWFIAMSVLYAVTGILFLMGVIFPPFAILASLFMGIISIVQMFMTTADPVTSYLEYLMQEEPEFVSKGVLSF